MEAWIVDAITGGGATVGLFAIYVWARSEHNILRSKLESMEKAQGEDKELLGKIFEKLTSLSEDIAVLKSHLRHEAD